MFKNRTNFNQGKARDLCLGLFVLPIVFFSCGNENTSVPYSCEIKEIAIHKEDIVRLNKTAVAEGRLFGSQFVDSLGRIVICGLQSPSSVYYSYPQEDRHEIYTLPFAFNFERDRIHFDEGAVTLFHANDLLSYKIGEERLDTIGTGILADDEFPNKEMYGSGIYKGESGYVLNHGKRNGGNFDNFIDKQAAYIVNRDSVRKILPYPEEFEREYVHYNHLLFLQDSGHVYYTFSVIPKLIQYDAEADRVVKTVDLVDKEKYGKYDHAKMTDMGYLATYSSNTNYNLRLFGTDDFVILLSYGPKGENTPSKNEWQYNIHVYDKDLNLLGNIPVRTPLFRNYVSCKDNSIYFSYMPESKAYVYTFSKR